jgi:hypothetical protein
MALDAEELHAIDGVLSPREHELGFPPVGLEYAPGPGASEARDEQVRRDVLRILFAGDSMRCAAADSSPGAHKKGPAPHHAPASSSHLSTATAPLSTGEGRRAYS